MAVTTGIYYNGVDIGSIFGAKGPSTAASTGILITGSKYDLNTLLLARQDGSDIGFNTGITSNGTDLRAFFGAPQTSLPINGKNYHVSAIFPSSGGGTGNFQFQLNGTTGWVTSCSRPGATGGTPAAGTIDSGSVPSGATSVRYTATYLGASGDTGTSTVTNNASSATALANGLAVGISLGGSGTTNNQSTYNFKVEFLNSSGSVISTTNFTCQMLTEGTA